MFKIKDTKSEFRMKKYKLIYADPAWQYNDKNTGGSYKSGAAQKYTVTSIHEMKRLPIHNLADDDCLLAMWHVAPMPQEALDLVKVWGFKLKTMKGFTWHKLTKNGLSHFGMGHYTRANTEDCLIATKGSPQIESHSIRQFIEAKIGKHSEKPPEIRDKLIKLCGDVNRIELFSRHSIKNWDSWGDQSENSIDLSLYKDKQMGFFDD